MSNQELLKAYSAYLPYEVKVMFEGEELEHSLVGLDTTSTPLKLISSYGDYGQASFEFSKLVLRPLSDLTKEIGHNGEKFVPIKELSKIDGEFYLEYDENIYLRDLSNLNLFEVTRGLTLINKLFEWHFDVFKLIGTHAINLNEVK